ncbi:MAG: hypothetical protein Q9208_002994 [Pyrenodesmia sp. 3 TL-2023]
MARTKPNHSPGGKKIRTISTSGIFKTHRRHKSPEDGKKSLAGSRLVTLPRLRKRRPKPKHWLSKQFSASVEHSRKHVEGVSTMGLNTARDALVTQTRIVLQEARDRRQEVDIKTGTITRPLTDEMLELTRKDETIIKTTLGKRMNAYRKMVTHEKKTLDRLFEQWAEVLKQINDFAVKVFGSEWPRSLISNPQAAIAGFETVEERQLLAKLEAEKKRVQGAAAAAGEKAMEALKANEKQLKLENQRRMQKFCDGIFDDGDG